MQHWASYRAVGKLESNSVLDDCPCAVCENVHIPCCNTAQGIMSMCSSSIQCTTKPQRAERKCDITASI